MPMGLVGRKCGMTRVFTEAGESVPVTVVEVLTNRVTQVKSEAVDGADPTGRVLVVLLDGMLVPTSRQCGVHDG